MKKLFLLLLFALPLALTSCYYDKYEDLYGPALNNMPAEDTSGVYSTNIQHIFADYCVSCHNDDLSSGGHNFSNWQGAHDAALSGRLIGAIEQQPGFTAMPQGGSKLDSTKIAAIVNWVNRGAPNN
jgi:mono/diheme cytochrome c family protein